MDNYSTTPPVKPSDDGIRKIEARLAEIEAGIFREYSYTSRTLITANFPHSARSGNSMTLINGNVVTKMYAPDFLPYGTYPRLLMCWITREAIIRRDLPIDEARTIPLGDSLGQFLRDVGVKTSTGGTNGSITQVRRQLIALMETAISVQLIGNTAIEDMPKTFHGMKNTHFAEDSHYWWDETTPGEEIQDLVIVLSKRFYTDLIESAVPLSNQIIQHVKRSPFAFDLYCWITYRLSYLRLDTTVTWDQLRGQLGANYPDTPRGRIDFKRNLERALNKVLEVWPEASVALCKYGLMLKPGEPSVSKKVEKMLLPKRSDNEPSPF